MSELIKGAFKGLFVAGSYLTRGHILRKRKGARYSSSREERRLFSRSNHGVLIDGHEKRLSTKDSFEHLAVIAKPGAGKSTCFVIPNILDRADRNNSMIALDPSGELFEATAGYLKKRGYKIKTLNPGSPSESFRFNPFAGLTATDVVEIEQICASIVLSKYGGGEKDAVWNDGAVGLIEIFAKCLAYSDPKTLNLVNINYLLQLFGSDGQALDDWVANHSINPVDIEDKTITDAWLGITKSNKNMLSSYTTIAKTALKQLNNRDIQTLLCEDDLALDQFRKEKTILYIIVPAHQQEYYQFLIDILYVRFFNIMMKSRPGKKDLDIYCFLDEFGSSYIKDFQAVINNIRKYRVSISIVLQTISQLQDKYGRAADSVKGGIGSYIVFAGADTNTAKEISESIGKEQIIERNRYTEIEQRYHESNLVNPDEIRTLEENEIIFLSKNRYPFLLKNTPFYENSRFRKRTGGAVPEIRCNPGIVENRITV